MRWKEKLEEMDGGRLVKQVYEGDIAGKRPRGQPKKRWIENFKWVKWTLRYHPLHRTYLLLFDYIYLFYFTIIYILA